MLGDGSPQSNYSLDHTCSEAPLVESEDGQAEASNARFRVCFVGSVHYSQPLDATSAKKFRSLETIGRIFVVGFATSLRPVWFVDGASFFLLPSLASPVFRYLMLYSAGLVVTLNWILVHGVTVVVTQGPYEGLCGAVAKQISRLFGKRVALLVESHGDFEQDLFLQRRIRFAGFFRWLILRISGFALRRADALRAVSRSTSEQLSRWAPGKPIVSFPAWTDMATFLAAYAQEPKDSKLILFAGMLIPRKAVDRLIEAFALVTRQAPEARLCIVGRVDDPEYLSLLTARVEQLDLRTCVTFLPPMPQSELARYMARAAALVLPSLSEGLGRVVFESMAAGTLVVASRVGGLVELVSDGKTGFLVPPGDIGELAARMSWVLAHPDRAVEMGRDARKFARVYFSTHRYVPGYRQAFSLALDSHQSGVATD